MNPAETELLLVRHGETAWNRDGRIQGHLQVELNERGRAQAEAVARRLADEPFDALYSSDLLRARQTADAIAAHSGEAVQTDPRLREWDLGVLAGETGSSASRRFPETWLIYREARPDTVVPGGESIRQRHQRVIAGVEAIAAAHRGQHIVVVSHGGPLDDCYRHASGLPLEVPRDFELYNASLNRFTLVWTEARPRWRLTSWSEVSHLDGMDMLQSTVGRGAAQ